MHQYYTLTSVIIENYRTKTLVLDRGLSAQPGQYVMVWLPGVGEKPYCITNDDPLTLTVVSVGPFSAVLSALEPGDKVWIRGPFGKGYHAIGQNVLLVGGGYGVASLLFLARKMQVMNTRVSVCIGAASVQDVLLLGAFEAAGIPVKVATEDGSQGQKGLVTELVETAMHAKKPDWLYACGPTAMLAAVSSLCRTHNLPHQLSWEAHIRCGLGVCGSCEGIDLQPWVHTGWLVCQDGPVQIVDISQ